MISTSEQSLRAVDPAVPIYVWRVDGVDLRLDSFNDAALAVTAGEVRRLAGRRASEMYADAPDVLDLFRRCRAGSTTVRQRLRYRFRSVPRTADLDITCTWVPPDRIAVTAIENALDGGPAEESGRFLTSLLSSLPAAGVAYRCRHDPDWTLLYLSEGCKALTGYDRAELLGTRAASLVHEDDLPYVAERVNAALLADRPFQLTYRIRRKGGGVRWVWDGGRGVGGRDGPLIEGLALDVTEARDLEDRLRQVQGLENVGQLTAGMAHDFNNLLSVILVDAELAKEGMGDGAQTPRALLEDIEHAARSGGALVQKLAAVARQSPLAIEPTDLWEVLREASTLIRRAVPENIELRSRLDQPVGYAAADGAAVEQIVLNLVLNARDAMPAGGVLAIELSEASLDERHRVKHPWVVPGRYACLAVSDTGVGMDAAVQERVFDPFFTTKPPGKGTGLGLAMVYGMVKQHRGHIHVESELGRGTTIRVFFPLAVDAVAAGAEAGEAGTIPGGAETVLLVEDELPLRDAARRALEHLGYTVLTAGDGVEALARLDDGAAGIDVVLSDLMLPRMTGSDLLRALRSSGGRIPFLLMTGYGADQVAGWDGFAGEAVLLQKPWTLPELARAVRQAIDRKAG